MLRHRFALVGQLLAARRAKKSPTHSSRSNGPALLAVQLLHALEHFLVLARHAAHHQHFRHFSSLRHSLHSHSQAHSFRLSSVQVCAAKRSTPRLYKRRQIPLKHSLHTVCGVGLAATCGDTITPSVRHSGELAGNGSTGHTSPMNPRIHLCCIACKIDSSLSSEPRPAFTSSAPRLHACQHAAVEHAARLGRRRQQAQHIVARRAAARSADRARTESRRHSRRCALRDAAHQRHHAHAEAVARNTRNMLTDCTETNNAERLVGKRFKLSQTAPSAASAACCARHWLAKRRSKATTCAKNHSAI
jgi:hypothetical protein